MKPSKRELSTSRKIWVSRILISIVVFWNLQASICFMSRPKYFLSSFLLSGEPGRVAIIGVGILFLMWQVPYVFALIDPQKFNVSLIQALIMQTIGLVAEIILISTISEPNYVLKASITRFIVFDGIGLILLLLAFSISKFNKKQFN